MPYDNRNRPSSSKDMNSLTNTRSRPFGHSRQKSSAMKPEKPLLSKRGKWTNNMVTKYQREHPLQHEMLRAKRVKSDVDSVESYHDIHNEDPVTMLRKEMREWRINELLTHRTEERFTGNRSEQHGCSYGAAAIVSGETTRSESPNNVSKTPPMSANNFPAVTIRV